MTKMKKTRNLPGSLGAHSFREPRRTQHKLMTVSASVLCYYLGNTGDDNINMNQKVADGCTLYIV